MLYVYAILMCLVNAVWLATVFFYLPGNWLIVLTTGALAWWQRDAQMISFWTVASMALLALVGEVIEFLAGLGGAKKAGAGWLASAAAILGALVGAVVGTFLIPVPFVGTLLGACIGAAWSHGALSGPPVNSRTIPCDPGWEPASACFSEPPPKSLSER